jgi:hypothetical protein
MRSLYPRSPIDHPSNSSKNQIFGQLRSLFLFFFFFALHPPSLASCKSDRRLCTPPLMVAPMALMGTALTPTIGIVDLDACSSKPMTWSHVRSFPIHPRPISCPTLAFCLSLTHHGFRLSHRSLVVQTWVNYLNCIFPNSTVIILSCGRLSVKITLTCIRLLLVFGLELQPCILRGQPLSGCSPFTIVYVLLHGVSFVVEYMIGSIEISMNPSLGNCFILNSLGRLRSILINLVS